MSYSVELKNAGHKYSTLAVTLQYVVRAVGEGEINSKAADDEARAEIPSTYTTSEGRVLQRKDILITEVGGTIDRFSWDVSAPYGQRAQGGGAGIPTSDKHVTRFSTKGGTRHITQSIETRGNYARPDKVAKDHNGAISVTKNGVQGADIGFSTFTWTEDHVKTKAQVNAQYQEALRRLTYRINDGPFRNSTQGEVVFLGVEAELTDDEEWALTFEFGFARTVKQQEIRDIRVGEVQGWDFVWIEYAPEEQTAARGIPERPQQVHVERVYEYGDFSGLQID